jgi:hypothetical protein
LPYSKTFVCFANSRKTSGRCVAGKELISGQPAGWIRPVSSRPTHEISIDERRYQDGRDPDLLHFVSVQLLAAQALPHQPENHLIDDSYYWSQQGTAGMPLRTTAFLKLLFPQRRSISSGFPHSPWWSEQSPLISRSESFAASSHTADAPTASQ